MSNRHSVEILADIDANLDDNHVRSYAFKTGYYMGHLAQLAERIPEVKLYLEQILINTKAEN